MTPGASDLGALGVGGAVEEQLDRAVGRDHRDAVAFEDAEIRDVAQVVALPGVAVDHHLVDAGRLPSPRAAAAARVGEARALRTSSLRCAVLRVVEAVVAPRRLGADT